MSANLKNASKIQVLLLSHIEKLVMALVVAGAGWLVYQSTSAPTEERQPNQLSQLVSTTKNKVDSFTWDDAVENAAPPPPVAESFRAAAGTEIDPNAYAVSRYGWDRSPLPPVVFRKDPVLLSAQEPEAHGFTVLMAFYDDANAKKEALEALAEADRKDQERDKARGVESEQDGRGRGGRDGRLGPGEDPNRRSIGSRRRGGVSLNGEELVKVQPCAIVTAKVPVQDQYRIYQDVFENALGHDPARDIPQYLGYYVQRAEVRGDKPLEFKPLKFRNGLSSRPLSAVNKTTIPAAVADWADELEDPIDPDYAHEALTFPLPPRVSSDWGPEVVHSGVPLAVETEMLQESMEDEDETLDPTAEGEDGPGFVLGDGSRGGRRGRFGRGGGDIMGDDLMMEGGPRRSGRRKRSRRGSGMPGEAEFFDVPHLMVRFIDFDVRPGRRYAYRFKLVMLDVNGKGQAAAKDLDKEVRDRVSQTKVRPGGVPFVSTEWSDASKPVSIPLAGAVRLAEVKQSATGEPTAKLLVSSFDLDEEGDAIEASIERDKIRLGSVMNNAEKDAWVKKGKWLEKVELFNFRTDVTLLDVAGGEKITRDMNSPGEALVMDATGRLMVRSALKDYGDFEQYKEDYLDEDSASGRRGGPPTGGDFMEDLDLGF